HIRVVETPGGLPVVVIERKGHRVDPGEILVVHEMLSARKPAALAPEMGRESPDDGVEDRNCRNLEPPAALLERHAQRFVDESEQHDAGVGLDSGQNPLYLALGAHHRPDVLDRLGILELDEAGTRDRVHGIAGGTGGEVAMEAAHFAHTSLWGLVSLAILGGIVPATPASIRRFVAPG